MSPTKLIIASFSFALLIGCAATPDSTEATPQVVSEATKTEPSEEATQTANKEATLDPNEEICKKSIVSGTRFKKKICMTRAQWDEQRAVSSRSASEMQRKGAQNHRSGATN